MVKVINVILQEAVILEKEVKKKDAPAWFFQSYHVILFAVATCQMSMIHFKNSGSLIAFFNVAHAAGLYLQSMSMEIWLGNASIQCQTNHGKTIQTYTYSYNS